MRNQRGIRIMNTLSSKNIFKKTLLAFIVLGFFCTQIHAWPKWDSKYADNKVIHTMTSKGLQTITTHHFPNNRHRKTTTQIITPTCNHTITHSKDLPCDAVAMLNLHEKFTNIPRANPFPKFIAACLIAAGIAYYSPHIKYYCQKLINRFYTNKKARLTQKIDAKHTDRCVTTRLLAKNGLPKNCAKNILEQLYPNAHKSHQPNTKNYEPAERKRLTWIQKIIAATAVSEKPTLRFNLLGNANDEIRFVWVVSGLVFSLPFCYLYFLEGDAMKGRQNYLKKYGIV